MFDAEYTHEGDRRTFEVLCARFELKVHGLRALSQRSSPASISKIRSFSRAETRVSARSSPT
jgi:hypothetical protein